MFTGIVEAIGEVQKATLSHGILNLLVRSPISHELRVDQSVSHDGACLTIVGIKNDTHTVQLVHETLDRTRFNKIKPGDHINLERSIRADGRFEGHFVQGHVDCKGELHSILDGLYTFRYPIAYAKYLVEKGSVCINGVSLTVARLQEDMLSVALIPYTLDNTNFNQIAKGDAVNLEFDILSKHLVRMIELGLATGQ